MSKYFGTDGIRAVANVGLTPELAFRLGRAAAFVLSKNSDEKSKIVVGMDTRISGDMLCAAISAGITSVGVDVIQLGVIPTPGVAVLCRMHHAAAGVVISASHNPFYDNGIKFFSATGNKLDDDTQDAIEYVLDNPEEIVSAQGTDIGRITKHDEAAYHYGEYLLGHFAPDLSGKKVVIDAANGAAYKLGVAILHVLKAETITIGTAPDGININKDCGSTHMEMLQKKVLEENAYIGLAFDGDADRFLAVDEKGNIIDGDMIIAICAAFLKEKGNLKNNAIVTTVMSNLGLKLAMQKLNINVLETKVGDKFVLEEMQRSGAVLGGEQSGHIIFSEYNSTGDGLASALFLLSVMEETRKPLSELAEIMTKLPQYLVNVKVSSKDWEAVPEIKNAYNLIQQKLEGRGRILVRPSGTEPVLRLMAEGDDYEEIKSIVDDLAFLVEEKLK